MATVFIAAPPSPPGCLPQTCAELLPSLLSGDSHPRYRAGCAAKARGKLSFHSPSRRHRPTSGGPLHARGARSRSCREGAFRPVNPPQVGASRKLCRDCCRRVLLLEPFLAFRSSQQTQAARIPIGIYLGCSGYRGPAAIEKTASVTGDAKRRFH
jgi:hypothetical protein